jgi:hypothetical protein
MMWIFTATLFASGPPIQIQYALADQAGCEAFRPIIEHRTTIQTTTTMCVRVRTTKAVREAAARAAQIQAGH